jgi:hypothetical protein
MQRYTRAAIIHAVQSEAGSATVAVTTKAKRKSAAASRAEKEEEAVFLAALKRHGQAQKAGGPLKPGVTHVLEPAKSKTKARLVRKRFSAI